MSVASKVWTAIATLYESAAFGGADADVGSSEIFTNDIDLETNGYEGVQIDIEASFPTSPTDNLNINVYSSLDGVNYNVTPIYPVELSNQPNPNSISIVIKDVAHLRLGLKSSGTTDTIGVRIKYKSWRWQNV